MFLFQNSVCCCRCCGFSAFADGMSPIFFPKLQLFYSWSEWKLKLQKHWQNIEESTKIEIFGHLIIIYTQLKTKNVLKFIDSVKN